MRVLGRVLTIMGFLFAACGSIESKRPATESNDFRPTDPSAVVLASGGPQLIEFYADW